MLVATNETLFETRADFEVYKVLRAISNRDEVGASEHNFFKSYTDMLSRFADMPKALAATAKVSALCEFRLQAQAVMLPAFSSAVSHEARALYTKAVRALEHQFYKVGKANKP